MDAPETLITGIGSVSTLGPVRGLIRAADPSPVAVTRWSTRGLRRAYMVPPFQPSALVPGLKARRLDQLSVWAIVASYLAMLDAEIDPKAVKPDRVAIVAGTGFGCLESSEAFLASVYRHGCGSADPILFPETLANSPAGHIARVFGFRGPNITLSCRGISGESALIQARSLLRAGEADLVIVVSGDMLTRSLYEWYEAASVLSKACLEDSKIAAPFSRDSDGFVPGEGVAAMVLEPARRRDDSRVGAYATIRAGLTGGEPGVSVLSWGLSPSPTVELIRGMIAARELARTRLVISSANGSPGLDRLEAEIIRRVLGPAVGTVVAAPKAISGEFEAGGVFRLALALSGKGIIEDTTGVLAPHPPGALSGVSAQPEQELALLLGTSAGGGRAALVLELLARARPRGVSA